MNPFKHYFKPSPIWARIVGDISLIFATISVFIDAIIPIVQEYSFGIWIEKNKGIVIVVLIGIKFLSNTLQKKSDDTKRAN